MYFPLYDTGSTNCRAAVGSFKGGNSKHLHAFVILHLQTRAVCHWFGQAFMAYSNGQAGMVYLYVLAGTGRQGKVTSVSCDNGRWWWQSTWYKDVMQQAHRQAPLLNYNKQRHGQHARLTSVWVHLFPT